MNPAYSVILFSTASGAGYGLLIWLALAMALHLVPADPLLGFCGMGVSLALITFGLLASTFHLGRPERAWRAFSQWRTSWLSREGVASIVTYIPAAALGLGWVFGDIVPGQTMLGAWACVPCALATVWCTGMIYASLPTIRAWNQRLVPFGYLLLALASGGVLASLLLAIFGREPRGLDNRWIVGASVVALVLAAIVKRMYWTAIDTAKRTHTAEAATGLGTIGTVRPLDPPHTQPNYIMREMGYQVARRHAERLRKLAIALLFFLPIVAELVMLLPSPQPLRIGLGIVAALGVAIGVLTERWLFFAEAEHVAMVYYRGGSA